jgi:hypothetical protein
MEHILTTWCVTTWLSSQFLAPTPGVDGSTPRGVTGGASRQVRPWGQAVLWDLLLGLPPQEQLVKKARVPWACVAIVQAGVRVACGLRTSCLWRGG